MVVHWRASYFGNDIPLFQWIGGIGQTRLMYNDSFDRLAELEKRAQGRVLQGLEVVEHGRLAIIVTIPNVL